MKQNNNFQATLKSINTPQLTFLCVCVWESFYINARMCVCVREHLQVDKFTSFALNFIRQLSQQTSGVLPALTATQMPTPSPPTLLQWPLLSCSFPMGRDSCQFSLFFLFVGHTQLSLPKLRFLLFILLSSRCSIIYIYTNVCVCVWVGLQLCQRWLLFNLRFAWSFLLLQNSCVNYGQWEWVYTRGFNLIFVFSIRL